MMTLDMLNERFSRYTRNLINKKQFEGFIIETILDNLPYFGLYNWNADDKSDFLSWVYPRLSKAIDNYSGGGAPFEKYIGAIVRWSSREYRSRSARRHATEYAVWAAREADMYVHGAEPEYFDDAGAGVVSKPARNPRQLLMLILKCYCYVSDDFLERLAPQVGLDKKVLSQMIDTLRQRRIKQHDNIRIMRERIHSQYFRCIIYEKRLRLTDVNSVHFPELKTQVEKARWRLETMRKRIGRIRAEATNQQVAELLGLSKGAVDSNLHALKKGRKK